MQLGTFATFEPARGACPKDSRGQSESGCGFEQGLFRRCDLGPQIPGIYTRLSDRMSGRSVSGTWHEPTDGCLESNQRYGTSLFNKLLPPWPRMSWAPGDNSTHPPGLILFIELVFFFFF